MLLQWGTSLLITGVLTLCLKIRKGSFQQSSYQTLVGSESSVECSLRNTACNTRAGSLWTIGLKCLRPTVYTAVKHMISLFSTWFWLAPWSLVPQTVKWMNTHRQQTNTSPVSQAHPIKYPGRVDFTSFFHYQVMKHGFMEVWNPTSKVWAHCLTNFSSGNPDQNKTPEDKEILISLLHIPAQTPQPDLPATVVSWEDAHSFSRKTWGEMFSPFQKRRDPPSHEQQRDSFYLEILSELHSKSPTALWLACAAAEVLLLISESFTLQIKSHRRLWCHTAYAVRSRW